MEVQPGGGAAVSRQPAAAATLVDVVMLAL